MHTSPKLEIMIVCVSRSIIKIEVVLGAQNITQTETTQLRVITQTYTIHPGWNSKKILNDLAVIKFPTAIKLTSNDFLVYF